jgi:hypothetical protein
MARGLRERETRDGRTDAVQVRLELDHGLLAVGLDPLHNHLLDVHGDALLLISRSALACEAL